VIYIF